MHIPYATAIASQPEGLQRSGTAVAEALRQSDLSAWRGGRITLVGMGASRNALRVVQAELCRSGVDARLATAADFVDDRLAQLSDAVVAVSQSGRSTETYEALQAAAELPRLVMTGDHGSPVGMSGTPTIDLDLLADSAVYTVGFTASLQALGMFTEYVVDGTVTGNWPALAEQVASELEATLDFARASAAALAHVTSIDLVASGSDEGIAAELALLFREACYVPTAALGTREYLHGPMESLQSGQAVIAIGGARELELAQDAVRIGAVAILITGEELPSADGVITHRVPASDGIQRAILEVVAGQRIIGELAGRLGRPIDGFRYAQRDIKLDAHERLDRELG